MKRYIITLILLITCTFTLTGCRNQTTDSGFKENVEIAWDDVKDDFDQIDQDVENDTSKQDVKALTQTILDGYDKIKEGITQDNQEEAKKIYEAASRLEYIEKNTDQKLSNEEKEISFICSVEENIDELDARALIIRETIRLCKTFNDSGLIDTTREYKTKKEKERVELIKYFLVACDNFIIKRPLFNTYSAIAGYPWFLDWMRDTLISYEGLFLVTKKFDKAKKVLQHCIRDIKYGLIPNTYSEDDYRPLYNSVDASLLFFEQVKKYLEYTDDYEFVMEEIYPKLESIIENYSKGVDLDNNNIYMDTDGLIVSGTENTQNTWMDAKYAGIAVTPRNGKPVEINAMWYNALKIMQELARKNGQNDKAKKYGKMAIKCKSSFESKFYNKRRKCLYDVLGDSKIRPNQLFALSLTYPVLDPKSEEAKNMFETVTKKLLNNYGLKSLATSDAGKSIQILYLGYNNLTEIPKEFAEMKKLSKLDCVHNKIKTLYPMGADIDLTQLTMDYNEIEEIPDNFSGINNIETYSFSHNKLKVLPDMFDASSIYVMSSVNFSYNEIASIENDGNGYKGINASTIDLSYNKLTKFPGAIIQAGSPVSSLTLAGNQISEFPKGASKGPRANMLNTLDLTFNCLTELPEDFSTNFYYIVQMDLSYNRFNKFPFEALYIQTLRSIAVRHQRDADGYRCMKEWPTNVATCPVLQRLFLGGNDIGEVPETEEISYRIYILDISDNPEIVINVSAVCPYITAGMYTLIYDSWQNIRGCPALKLENK